MKYAVIAMVAIYVIALSISPNEEEKTAASDTQDQQSVVAIPQQEQAETQVVTHEQTVETHAGTEGIVPAGTDKKVPANEWEALAQSATQNVLALMNGDATLPQPEKKAVKGPAAPCPGVAAQAGHGQPATKKPCPVACPGTKVQGEVAGSPDLDTAMQKLANATNDMVAVTRQLVGATQEMLAASKKVAVEVIDSGKELLEDKEAQAAAQAKLVEAVQDVVDATKEAYEATSEALSGAVQSEASQQ